MYINRKDALEILRKLSREPYYQHEGEDYYVGIAEATGEIYSMPSEAVIPVVHADWVVPDKHYPITCSHCMLEFLWDDDEEYIPKYCPECGAQMGKEVRHLYL